MAPLVIGVPARQEGDNIADLADRLERGVELLGPTGDAVLVLGYQPGGDDTRERFEQRPGRIARHVLQAAPGDVGKGRNVKALVAFARELGAGELLLVDADLRAYQPDTLVRVVTAAREHGHSLVLPLWRRPPGQENTTKYLASPLLRAAFDARVRQPIAGHMLLDHRLVDALDLEALPDDFGVDLAITLTALAGGYGVGQVVVSSPRHESRSPANSEHVMRDVAHAALVILAALPTVSRADVAWLDGYSARVADPPSPPAPPSGFLELLARRAGTEHELGEWVELLDAPAELVTNLWSGSLAGALRACRRGHDAARLVDGLVAPFLIHAEHRRRHGPTDGAAVDAYVAELGERVAASARA
jgi:hypothetical protein